MSSYTAKTVSQFVELTRIIRVAVILDHLFEFIEDTVPRGHPVWSLFDEYADRNEVDFENWLAAIELDLGIIRADEPDPGNNNHL